jgi:hypothetical protein
MGSIVLFSSSRACDACDGTGQVPSADAPGAGESVTSTIESDSAFDAKTEAYAEDHSDGGRTVHYEDGSIKHTCPISTAADPGTFTVTTDASTGSGSGGDITIVGGNAVGGNLTITGGGSAVSQGWHDELVRWTVARLVENLEPKDDADDWNIPAWQCAPDVPVVAPVFPATLADMMSLVEQEGFEIDLFVTSCRDFADVRKWDDTEKVRWEGKRVWVFGIEVVRDQGVPRGHFCAVSRSKKMSVATICR